MNEPLAICNVLIVAITVYISYQGFKHADFMDKYLFSTERVLRGREYHRFITSGFIHLNWPHLLFNMFSLYVFGGQLESVFGALPFLLIFFVSILGGGMLSLFLHRHHDYRALGASGGVCGIIFASIFLLPGGGIYIFPIPIAIPAWLRVCR